MYGKINNTLLKKACMKFYFLILILITQTSLGQSGYEDNEDPFKTEIDKNIFRTLLSLSTDNQFSIQINFEHQIYKSFTFFLKAGPAISRSKIFFPNDYREYRFAFSAIASGVCSSRFFTGLILFCLIKRRSIKGFFAISLFKLSSNS